MHGGSPKTLNHSNFVFDFDFWYNLYLCLMVVTNSLKEHNPKPNLFDLLLDLEVLKP
jgi:hypothetical protein